MRHKLEETEASSSRFSAGPTCVGYLPRYCRALQNTLLHVLFVKHLPRLHSWQPPATAVWSLSRILVRRHPRGGCVCSVYVLEGVYLRSTPLAWRRCKQAPRADARDCSCRLVGLFRSCLLFPSFALCALLPGRHHRTPDHEPYHQHTMVVFSGSAGAMSLCAMVGGDAVPGFLPSVVLAAYAAVGCCGVVLSCFCCPPHEHTHNAAPLGTRCCLGRCLYTIGKSLSHGAHSRYVEQPSVSG